MFWKKQKRTITVGGQVIELEPKPAKGTSILQGIAALFKKGKAPEAKPAAAKAAVQPAPPQGAAQPKAARPAGPGIADIFKKTETPRKEAPIRIEVKPTEAPKLFTTERAAPQAPAGAAAGAAQLAKPQAKAAVAPTKPGAKGDQIDAFVKNYTAGILRKHKTLETDLKSHGLNLEVGAFVKRLLIGSALAAVVFAFTAYTLFSGIGSSILETLFFTVAMGYVGFKVAEFFFLRYPTSAQRNYASAVERDILFAARDMMISLRSGMPLFNTITSVSTGYGAASKEFAKIVDRVQLGMPLDEAIEETVEETQSSSFRRIMLQASVSIRAGADVVNALQSIIDQLSQERVIELRSYGQKLNAIAMFYMLFGIILPSMGIAVVTILTTFISLFSVTLPVLEAVIVGIIFLQIVFLRLIVGSRPVFSM